METTIQAVWYIDDNNIKHITVVQSHGELAFLKERFGLVGLLEDFF